jgi:hypothetical protein
MGKKAPPLVHKRKEDMEDYIRNHLFIELSWLLYAATEWSLQNQLKLGIGGYHVQVYAMDSAFLHARTLFEFFVQPPTSNHYSSKEFLGAELISHNYSANWKDTLHKFLMHAQDRSRPIPLKNTGVGKDLNQMPVDFAREILRLWEEFESKLGESKEDGDKKLGELARDKRKEAIENAQCVVESAVAQQHAKNKGQILMPVFVFVG